MTIVHDQCPDNRLYILYNAGKAERVCIECLWVHAGKSYSPLPRSDLETRKLTSIQR